MRARSLFWTFAGVFLVVLVGATALQFAVSVGVLRPLALQETRDRATAAIDRVAPGIAALADPSDPRAVIPVLRRNAPDGSADILAFCVAGGPVIFDRQLGGDSRVRTAAALMRAQLVDSATAMRAPIAPPGGPDGFRPPGDGPPPRGPDGLGPDRGGPPPHGEPGVEPRPPGPGRAPRFEVLAHRSVVRDDRVLGELAVVGPVTRGAPWAPPGSRPLLLLLPIAVLAAGAAGLIMVRILVRRLRALEAAAGRVIEGDLAARIETQGRDEIGRIEQRFNRMTERLAAARAHLERNDQQRRRLLADITHELATPLTSIRGYVETLLDPAVTTTAEERTVYLRDVLDEARRLDDMIGELFELARLEAGATPLRPVRLDWMALCRNITRRLEPRFREAGLDVAWEGPERAAWVRADGRRLEQLVENLLVNALRYVPAGGHVRLAIECVDAGADSRQRLTVSDDGPGIAAGDLDHVFERFYRAEAARSMGGTGLGLAIVAEIVRQHGGEVRAERREPHGAAFIVELPALADGT
jgi:two-component system, OmpR family, sensor histidine kinase BaeS